jgi:hypothetical protein
MSGGPEVKQESSGTISGPCLGFEPVNTYGHANMFVPIPVCTLFLNKSMKVYLYCMKTQTGSAQ